MQRIYANLYARYVIIVNNLGDIYDQTLQVQKRNVVEQILLYATQRMLQLQTELKDIEMSEFTYIDHTLYEEKFIPQDVALLRPFYYPAKRILAMQEIVDGKRTPSVDDGDPNAKKTLKFLLEEAKRLDDEKAQSVDKFAEAVKLIKAHEKLRYRFSGLFSRPRK